jgi:feruloyl esterase
VRCGGLCGRLQPDRPGFTNAINHALRRSYAVVAMDGGHWGSNLGDPRWAYQNPVQHFDLGERAVTATARAMRR